jgi:hypothetical protein
MCSNDDPRRLVAFVHFRFSIQGKLESIFQSDWFVIVPKFTLIA